MAGFMPAFNAGSAAIPATKVELSISCRNLVDMDVFSKSDPMVVLYIKEFGSQTFKEVGRTETINDNLNPDFAKKFIVDYFFEESQKLKFEVYDVDSASRNLREHDFLGSLECTLAQVVTEAVLRKPLQGPTKNRGAIIVSSEEVSSCKEEITLRFNAKKLDKKDFFGKSDPFLSFHKAMEDGSYILTYRTEVIKNTLNPTWRPFTVPVRLLCNGDYDRSIKIECWDWNSSGSHDYIGECLVTLRELSKGSSASNVFDCVNSAKQKKKKGYKNSGTIELMQCTIVQAYSFLDFVKGGMQLNCTIAIDFTASNGNPLTPTSLHYIAPYSPNQYTQALASVGEIIKDYDSDQLFPALGFGARLPPEGRVSHEFFLNGNPENPYCQGIDGVLAAYQQALHTVQLYGPTNFAPVINHVSRFASAIRDGSQYFILLILTDGIITDMPQTKEAVVCAASLPMSIIIVGVGDADFDAMEELDGDDVRVSSHGRVAERDIVQFVPYRQFTGGTTAQGVEMNKARLAKEVLAEIPDQITSFMKRQNMKPRPPLQRQPTLPTAPM